MVTGANSANNTKYVNIYVRDAQSGIKKEYAFPEGTEFRTTNHMFKISASGIKKHELVYEEKYYRSRPEYMCTLPDKTIDITLPQLIALGVFDINKDKKIDSYDAKNIKLEEGSYGDGHNSEASPVTDEINENLKRANSSYCVYDPYHCTTGVSIKRNGLFSATFVKNDAPDPYADVKYLDIHLPAYAEELRQHDIKAKKFIDEELRQKEEQKRIEEEKQLREKVEQKRIEEEKQLDAKYAEKHWFKYYFLNITRQEFEQNNERDY